jgi:hypothetical protein
MSIKGTTQELFVGKKKSTIVTLFGKNKIVKYEDLKYINYMYSSGTEIGFLSFVNYDNRENRFEFAKSANDKISRTIDLIKENMPNLEIREQQVTDLKFYQRNLFTIIISFILGFPLGTIGLYLMWHYKKSYITARMLVTFMVLLFWGTCGYLTYTNYKSAMNEASAAMTEYRNALNGNYPNEQEKVINESYQENTAASSNSEYENVYEASTYKIGKDMPAGEYVLFAEDTDINYFQVSNDSSGSLTSISSNGVFKTNTIVNVDNGQYFNFTGCYAVPITEASTLDITKEGMFKIGLHLEPGEYQLWKLEGSDISYYAIMKDSTHRMESIKTNGVLEGREYVTVEKGEYLELQGCYIIE